MVKPGYKQSEVGIIPEDWGVSALRAAFPKLEAGVSVNSDNMTSSKYHVLKTSAVHNGIVDPAEVKPVIKADYGRLKCPLVQGSIIISRMNTPALVGECGYVKNAPIDVYLPDRLWQVQNPKDSDYNFEWLNYLLNTKRYRDAVRATATGTSNSMKNISKERLMEIDIPCLSLDEQNRISAALSDIDTLIANLEKLIAKKKAIKQGAMQELLTGRRRLPGFSGQWTEYALGDFVECIRGVSYDGSADLNQFETAETVRLLRSNNIKNARFVDADVQYVYRNKVKLPQHLCIDDIMVCMANGSRSLVGKSCYFEKPFIGDYTFGAFMSCIRKKDSDTNMYYIFNLMNSDSYWNQIAILFSGSSINNLRPTDILNMRFLFPLPNEQTAICEVIQDMESEILDLEGKLCKYQGIMFGMMSELLTGRIRLIDKEDA